MSEYIADHTPELDPIQSIGEFPKALQQRAAELVAEGKCLARYHLAFTVVSESGEALPRPARYLKRYDRPRLVPHTTN
jgi:hypothetical protein